MPTREHAPEESLRLELPWSDVREWHARICRRCDELIALCSKTLRDRHNRDDILDISPRDIQSTLLEEAQTCNWFGAPGGKPFRLSPESDLPSEAMRQRWGRQLAHHAFALRNGFRSRKQVEPSDDVLRRLHLLESLGDSFTSKFPTIPTTVDDLKQALRSDGAHIRFAQFAVSHVDPILHSSLFYLNRYDQELTFAPDLQNFLTNNAEKVLEQMMTANGDVSTVPLVVDDANLWWAHYDLLRRRKSLYVLNGQAGFQVAAEVCRALIKKGNDLSTPSWKQAIYEIPPEVYGIHRTRLLVLKHCIGIASLMPRSIDHELPRLISNFALEQFHTVSTKSFDSAYLVGLELQVSSEAMLYLQRVLDTRTTDKVDTNETRDTEVQSHSTDDAEVAVAHVAAFNSGATEDHSECAGTEFRKSSNSPEAVTRVWLVGKGVFEIEKEDGSSESLAISGHFGTLLEALVDLRAAIGPVLTEETKIENPGRFIRDGLKKYEFLRPFVKMPEKRNCGGYSTQIKRKKKDPQC